MPFTFWPTSGRRGALMVLDGNYAGLAVRFPINPASWKDSHAANFAGHQVIGRGHPKSIYTSGGPREISFEFPLCAKDESLFFEAAGLVQFGKSGGNATPIDRMWGSNYNNSQPAIQKLVFCLNLIQALTYPREFTRDKSIEGEILSGPPPVLFVWGAWTRIRCIVKSYTITYEEWDSQLDPLRAKVELSLEEQPSAPMTFQRKLNHGDMLEAGSLHDSG